MNYPSALKDGSWGGSVSLKQGTVSLDNVVDFVTGSYIMVKLVNSKKMSEGKNYTLEVLSIPGPRYLKMGSKVSLGNVIISVGKQAKGGTGWSTLSDLSFVTKNFALRDKRTLL